MFCKGNSFRDVAKSSVPRTYITVVFGEITAQDNNNFIMLLLHAQMTSNSHHRLACPRKCGVLYVFSKELIFEGCFN